MNEVTLTKMKQMKFYGMYGAFKTAIETGKTDNLSLDEFLKIVEKRFIELALKEKNYNFNRSAEKLDITFRSLRYRIDNLDIKTP